MSDKCEDIYRAHYERRQALGVERRGNVIGPREILDRLPRSAFKVRDWRDGTAPKTKNAAYKAIIAADAFSETQFDAAHGRRYRLCVFKRDDRNAIVSFGTWPADND